MKVISKIFGNLNEREIKRTAPLVSKINALEDDIKGLSDQALRAKTEEFKARLKEGAKLDSLLPEAFAVTREAARRTIEQRHYDVQLIGGIILHQGKIAEMRTGEGKTLVATAPVYLNALTGKGVHVVTVNDYLARRDAGWMGQVYHALGLSTGIIMHDTALLYDPEYDSGEHDDPRLNHLRPVTRKEAYQADITYGTNNEFGFDYLRDNMVDDVEKMVQRPLHYAIVDEVDSILIDEARTPLIISAPAEESTDKYYQFAKLASRLKRGDHYTVDEKLKAVSLTEEGMAAVEKALGVENVYEAGMLEDVHHIEQSLKAEAIYRRDKDYVVRDGEITIVDEFTGRLMPGRRWSDGLHQAVEAKEGVEIKQESMTLATITFQNLFRLYEKLAGMTGTAATEAEEFNKIYNLDVLVIPTHRPNARTDMPDRIYKTELGKFRAVARDVLERNKTGQPVLIGTASIAKNELMSQVLTELKVPHQVLNAKNNEGEATIVAAAGQKGAVTIATNIAGRGTDIVLGEGVSDLGGLHVIGTERHESRRIDNQLRGRSGRQGDPGSSQFYVSLEDDLMRIFGSDRIAAIMDRLGIDEDTPIENQMISRSLEGAQKKVEGHNFDTRKQLVEYDDVMNKHREVVYLRRRKALENANLRPEILKMMRSEFEEIVRAHRDVRTEIVDTEQVLAAAANILPVEDELRDKVVEAHGDDIVDLLVEYADKTYDLRVQQFGDEGMRRVERFTYLQVLDRLWIQHLEAMDTLREGIGLRGIGQRDPLVEYKREGFRFFETLMKLMNTEIVSTIFRVAPVIQNAEAPVETPLTRAAREASTNTSEETAKAPRKPQKSQEGSKVGRNEVCPCGSGLKYKKCGMIDSQIHRANVAKVASV